MVLVLVIQVVQRPIKVIAHTKEFIALVGRTSFGPITVGPTI